jgi:DNA-binding transcriptional regulator YhcF (GntR family)
MNLIATQTQKQLLQLWRRTPVSLQERIRRFFIQHCVYPAGHKVFNILMERLADELNDSRLNVSKALNQMQREGVIELHRGRVVIPQLERLMF